jgi:hypothetical protein
VNEADLHARHRWLVEVARPTAERVMKEPHFFDPKIAGWWVWGQCLWIGSGWCQRPEWTGRGNGAAAPRGINNELISGYGRAGNGVEQKRRPQLTGDQGVMTEYGKRPALSGTGGACIGVHRSSLKENHKKRPKMGSKEDGGRGCVEFVPRTEGLYDYMRALAERLRRVRVCCGDWKRVLTPSVTTYIGVCGVFLDPPYDQDLRERCYSEDHNVSADVREWALANGDNPDMRIALCGYEGEHIMPDTWECVPWKAHGGYSRTERGKANRSRERIWFSPHCLKAEQPTLL